MPIGLLCCCPLPPHATLIYTADSRTAHSLGKSPMLTLDEQTASDDQCCDWCRAHLTTRIIHYDGQHYCSRSCFELGSAAHIGRPLFEAKPFPPDMAYLKARLR